MIGDRLIAELVQLTGFPGRALNSTGTWAANCVVGFEEFFRSGLHRLGVAQQTGQQPGIFQPLPSTGAGYAVPVPSSSPSR